MQSKKAVVIAALCLFTTGAVVAKLPPPSDEQKAKAEETKAKGAEAAKKDAELLAKSQDGVADHGDRDRRTGFLGADQHAFHRAFFDGRDLPGQCGRSFRAQGLLCLKENERQTGG